MVTFSLLNAFYLKVFDYEEVKIFRINLYACIIYEHW